MTWAKIEIEFQPDMHDPNDVMLMLANYFQADGIPTAVVALTGYAPEAQCSDDVTSAAARIWSTWKTNMGTAGSAKIGAIKELRATTFLSLRDAKDAIDMAAARNP